MVDPSLARARRSLRDRRARQTRRAAFPRARAANSSSQTTTDQDGRSDRHERESIPATTRPCAHIHAIGTGSLSATSAPAARGRKTGLRPRPRLTCSRPGRTSSPRRRVPTLPGFRTRSSRCSCGTSEDCVSTGEPADRRSTRMRHLRPLRVRGRSRQRGGPLRAARARARQERARGAAHLR